MRLRVPALNRDHPRALIERRRGAPHELIEKDKDHGGDGDHDGHRQPAGEREAPRSTQHADPEPGVQRKAVEPRQSRRRAPRFAQLRDAAQLHAGGTARLRGGEPAAPAVFFGHFEVDGQLLVEVRLESAGTEEPANAGHDHVQESQHDSALPVGCTEERIRAHVGCQDEER
jgi:hypothetical protein